MNSFATIAVILGILFAIGVVRAVQTHQFVREAVRVRAKVVDVLDATVSNPDTSSQSSPTSRYVIEIPGPGARKRRASLTDAVGGSIADKFVKDDGTIAVIYHPSQPGVIRIDSPWVLYFIPGFLCAPAVLFLLLVLYVWLRT